MQFIREWYWSLMFRWYTRDMDFTKDDFVEVPRPE